MDTNLFLRAAAAVVFAAAGLAQPVSYSGQIAPILAMNCHNCHGGNPESAAGGLSTRTWADLMKGGNLGPVVIAGDPERSALFQFVSGARGDAHRMPLGGPPLTTEQIGLIRRWILEGATQDVDTSRKYRLTLPALALEPSRPIRISCRVPSAAYVELSLADSQERILFMEGGAVKEVRDATAIGAPDGWITSALRRASDWPAQLRAHLTVAYAASEPVGAMIVATEDTGAGNPDFPDGEAEVQVIDTRTDKLMFRRREHVSGGLPDVQRWNDRLPAGLYVLHLRHLRMRCEVAMLFRSRQ